MRPARALALLLPVVLLAPAGGVVSPAAAAEATVLTISDRPDPAIFHDDIGPRTADVVRHSGKLTTAGGEPIAEATVTLWRQMPGEDWVEYAEDTETDANGRYVFDTWAEGNAVYQTRYAGDGLTYTPVDSAIESLKVMRDFNAVLVQKPRKAILKGNINPGWNNKVVSWQKKKCEKCRWRTVAKEKAGDKGAWSFVGRYPPVGKQWFYRATIRGADGFTRSESATLVTTMTPADRVAARTTLR